MRNDTPNRLRCQACGGPLPPRARRWCSKTCANAGYHATHRADRTAKQRVRRETARRIKAGLPPELTPEQKANELVIEAIATYMKEGPKA